MDRFTGTPLDRKEVCEMVHIAHEEGLAVMSHTNGIYGVQAAVEAGVDSVEHGNYIDPETIIELADSDSVWVPTLVTIRNLRGCGRYKESVLDPIIELAAKRTFVWHTSTEQRWLLEVMQELIWSYMGRA